MKKTAILILAAGKSSRMGVPKQLLQYKETTLLGWAIEQAQQSIANEVFCVLGANAKTIQKKLESYKIEILFNSNYKDGLGASIATGINCLATKKIDSLLIMLADQPNVNADYLNELITTAKENPKKIITSTYNDNIGVPALFPKHYFNQLLQLKGDKGAKEFLHKQQYEIIKMKPINLIDIDTKEQYLNLIK